jgi:hypothetical protein
MSRMNETIYNLVPREYSEPHKRPTPKSGTNHAKMVPYSTFGKL